MPQTRSGPAARPSLALDAMLIGSGLPPKLSARFDALEASRDAALPRRGHIRH